jgi:ElaB/YqjD/DUF883 family membrane-anchored ribosome-binding protein
VAVKENTMPQQRTDYPLDYSRGGAETAKERERGMADAATDRMKDAAESSHGIASNVAEKIREHGEEAQAAAKQFRSSMEKSVKEQPLAMLAAVCAIGFLLGALWKK